MAGCCLGSDTRNCGWVSSCVDYQSYSAGSCGSSCLLNDFIRKCTNLAAPYCATYTYPSGGVADYGCDSDSNALYTVRQTGTDSFGSAESVRLSTVTSARFTTATYTSYNYYTPSRKAATKLAIGTIIGIVIAVLAIIFIVIIGICMCMKRKKKQKLIAANAGIVANAQANRPQSQFQPVTTSDATSSSAASPKPPAYDEWILRASARAEVQRPYLCLRTLKCIDAGSRIRTAVYGFQRAAHASTATWSISAAHERRT
jgi:hypothetical protein